ncbi:MAG: nucleotidyltransferase family protein [Planctomycetes bacterium]|nr:nucleotidyltransferase family protein [Planctomycetota bacterium]
MDNRDRPELELLLYCLRMRLGADEAERIRALIPGRVDWGRLLGLARDHGVVPLLHTGLSAACSDAVPEDFMAELASYVRKNTLRNLTLTGTLLHLLDRLQSRGIDAIPYKGPLLAVSAYGDIGLRQFDDLDILVRRRDLSQAMDVLTSEGYRPPWGLPGRPAMVFSDVESHCNFSPKKGRFALEIHWEVFPRYFTAASRVKPIWDRLRPVRIMDTEVQTFSAQDLLLILCVRGSRQFWSRLCWLCDVAEMTRDYGEEEWETVLLEAERTGMRRAVFLGLFLAEELLGVRLPAGVVQEVSADPVVKRLALPAVKRMAAEVREDASGLERLSFHLALRERLADKIQYCLRRGLAPTQSDWAFMPIPSCPYGAYYLIRPIRLVLSHGLVPMRNPP